MQNQNLPQHVLFLVENKHLTQWNELINEIYYQIIIALNNLMSIVYKLTVRPSRFPLNLNHFDWYSNFNKRLAELTFRPQMLIVCLVQTKLNWSAHRLNGVYLLNKHKLEHFHICSSCFFIFRKANERLELMSRAVQGSRSPGRGWNREIGSSLNKKFRPQQSSVVDRLLVFNNRRS